MATEYSTGYIMLGSSPLTEVSEVSVEEDSGDKAVDTLIKGRSGYSNGPESCKVTLKSAIPRAGYEAPFLALCRRHQTITVKVRLGGMERVIEGRIMTVKTDTSVGAPSAQDVSIDGKVISESPAR